MTFDDKTQPRRLPFVKNVPSKPYSAIGSTPHGFLTEYADATGLDITSGLDLTWTEPDTGVFHATEPVSGKIRILIPSEGVDNWYEADGTTPTDPPGTAKTAPKQPSRIQKAFAPFLKRHRWWPAPLDGSIPASPHPAGRPYTDMDPPETDNTSGLGIVKHGGAHISHAATTPMLASGPRTHPITDVAEPGGERLLTDYTTTSPDPDGQAQSHGSEHPSTSGFDPNTPTIAPALTPSASGGTMLSGDVRYRLTNRKTIAGVVAESDKGPIVSGSVTGPHGSVSVHADAETDTSIESRGLYREDPSSPDRWHLVHEEAGYAAFTFVDTKSFTVLRHDNYALTRHGLYPKYDGARNIPSGGGGSAQRFQVENYNTPAATPWVVNSFDPIPFDTVDFDETGGALTLNPDGTVTVPAGSYDVFGQFSGKHPISEPVPAAGDLVYGFAWIQLETPTPDFWQGSSTTIVPATTTGGWHPEAGCTTEASFVSVPAGSKISLVTSLNTAGPGWTVETSSGPFQTATWAAQGCVLRITKLS